MFIDPTTIDLPMFQEAKYFTDPTRNKISPVFDLGPGAYSDHINLSQFSVTRFFLPESWLGLATQRLPISAVIPELYVLDGKLIQAEIDGTLPKIIEELNANEVRD